MSLIYVLYGEIDTDLRVGQIVAQGEKIGTMQLAPNKYTLMVHIEVFIGGFGSWSEDNGYRVDPTFVLDFPTWRSLYE